MGRLYCKCNTKSINNVCLKWEILSMIWHCNKRHINGKNRDICFGFSSNWVTLVTCCKLLGFCTQLHILVWVCVGLVEIQWGVQRKCAHSGLVFADILTGYQQQSRNNMLNGALPDVLTSVAVRTAQVMMLKGPKVSLHNQYVVLIFQSFWHSHVFLTLGSEWCQYVLPILHCPAEGGSVTLWRDTCSAPSSEGISTMTQEFQHLDPAMSIEERRSLFWKSYILQPLDVIQTVSEMNVYCDILDSNKQVTSFSMINSAPIE